MSYELRQFSCINGFLALGGRCGMMYDEISHEL